LMLQFFQMHNIHPWVYVFLPLETFFWGPVDILFRNYLQVCHFNIGFIFLPFFSSMSIFIYDPMYSFH
jgi:hypothetical protein